MNEQTILLTNEVVAQHKETADYSISTLIRNLCLSFVNYQNKKSLAYKFRAKRFELFENFTSNIERTHILDAGGTQSFWNTMKFTKEKQSNITLLNLTPSLVTSENFSSIVGDATNMPMFKDKEFDIAFSNSVIEHVGDYSDQKRMAEEIQRVGKHYFLQTPCKYFPIEPHFIFPLFQFLPHKTKVYLTTHFSIGSFEKQTIEDAETLVESVRLLNKKELKKLFPNAQIYEEKLFFFTKSYIVYA